jgi:uncharacterized membrane protein
MIHGRLRHWALRIMQRCSGQLLLRWVSCGLAAVLGRHVGWGLVENEFSGAVHVIGVMLCCAYVLYAIALALLQSAAHLCNTCLPDHVPYQV